MKFDLLDIAPCKRLFLFDVCRIHEFLESNLKSYAESCRKIFEDEEIMNLYAQCTRIL